jgi:hypothetical protein
MLQCLNSCLAVWLRRATKATKATKVGILITRGIASVALVAYVAGRALRANLFEDVEVFSHAMTPRQQTKSRTAGRG